MRSIALCVCAYALGACSTESTEQTPAAVEGENVPPGQQSGKPAGAKGGGQGGGAASADASTNGGCTFTQGYWKNHPSAWPVTSLTIGGVVYSEQQLLALFDTAPKGDASLISPTSSSRRSSTRRTARPLPRRFSRP